VFLLGVFCRQLKNPLGKNHLGGPFIGDVNVHLTFVLSFPSPARHHRNGRMAKCKCPEHYVLTRSYQLDSQVSRGVIEDDGKAIKAWTESSGEGRYLSIYINEFTHIYF
jgi:hypothetical protein